MAKISFEKFLDFWTYYAAEEHQKEGIRLLYGNLNLSIEEDAAWIAAYRNAPEPEEEIDTFVQNNTEGMTTSKAGIDLIKAFEGCELSAYWCPAGVLTIGYGHTGSDVYQGQTITEEEATIMLRIDLNRFEDAVRRQIKVPLKQCEFDALVSFTYNCGEGALQHSTLRRRLHLEDDNATIFKEELPKWVNGNNGPLLGLVRRREAEIKLATYECKSCNATKDVW